MYLIVDEQEKVITNPLTNRRVYKKQEYAVSACKKLKLDKLKVKIVHLNDLVSIKAGKIVDIGTKIFIPPMVVFFD